MAWLSLLLWLWKCLFTCNHGNTTPNEGKCFCPDCGRGVIYQWIVLRCPDCKLRRDSRYLLRRIVPSQRCCAYCGTAEFHMDILDTPAYFQLRKARLLMTETPDYQPDTLTWSVTAFTHPVGAAIMHGADQLKTGWQQTLLWIEPQAPPACTLVLLPLYPSR